MKKIIFITTLAAMTLGALTGCPGKGGSKGDQFVTSPNSCFNYTYVQPVQGQNPYYMNQQQQPVNCNPGYYQGYNNYFQPYNQYVNGQYMNGCASWSQVYPGSYYVPMQIVGYGTMCVNTAYYQQLPGFNQYYSNYGAYPTYAQSCQQGVNCPASCFSAGGGGAQNGGSYWLGGTLSVCL